MEGGKNSELKVGKKYGKMEDEKESEVEIISTKTRSGGKCQVRDGTTSSE